MDNSNIIISVIIVLCIAAGVTAYGINEGNNAVFSDLSGFTASTDNSGDNGIGNTTANHNNSNKAVSSTTTAKSNSVASSNSVGSSSGRSNSVGSSSGGSGSVYHPSTGTNPNHNTPSKPKPSGKITVNEAKNEATKYIGEKGCYVNIVVDKGSYYNCLIYDSKGNWVSTISIDAYTKENLGLN